MLVGGGDLREMVGGCGCEPCQTTFCDEKVGMVDWVAYHSLGLVVA